MRESVILRTAAVAVLSFGAFVGSQCLRAGQARAAGSGYKISGKIAVEGEGGWDYLLVDEASRRLYLSHATHVVVYDVDSRKVVGDIPDTPGVHGIALAPDLGRGFGCGQRKYNRHSQN